jgi:hypothetical protein
MVVLHETIGHGGKRDLKCVLGPFWPVMVCVTYPLIIGLGTVIATLFFPKSSAILNVLYVVLIVMVCIFLAQTACSDPGILRRHRECPDAEDGVSWHFSDQAQTYRPTGAYYCSDCNCVIEEYDHVCPWTGTGIGKANLHHFHRFVGSIVALICYITFMLMYTMF